MEKTETQEIELITLGHTAVGKTSIISSFVDQKVTPSHMSTYSFDSKKKEVERDGKKITLKIWDTGGQERLRALAPNYIRRAHGIFLIYDITSRDSFDQLAAWLESIYASADKNSKIILVGNKIDLDNERDIESEMGQSFAIENDIMFFETSAYSGEGIDTIFNEMLTAILNDPK